MNNNTPYYSPNDIPNYKTRVVRDLAHACFGQNLVNNFDQIESTGITVPNLLLTKERLLWLQRLDDNPTPLHSHLDKLKSKRLGIYFESLWQFFIQQDSQLELIAHNLAISDDKRTIGEFDILYRDKSCDKCIHLELAIKFFLNQSPNGVRSSLSNWLGPNTSDRLDRKLAHLTKHQIALSDHPAARPVLNDLGIQTLQKEVAVKGILFYPYPHQPTQHLLLSSQHPWSHWLFIEQIEMLTLENTTWTILPKPYWLSPLSIRRDSLAESELVTVSGDELYDFLLIYFSESNSPVMVCSLENRQDLLIEKRRYFITPNDWPN